MSKLKHFSALLEMATVHRLANEMPSENADDELNNKDEQSS